MEATRTIIQTVLKHLPFELNPTFYVLLFCFIFPLFFVLLKLRRATSNEPTLPPSPPKFPFIGNLHQLGTLPHRSLTALSRKHGPLMLLRLGQTPTLVVSSAHFAKEMAKSHDVVFSDRPQTTAAKILLYGCKDVGFLPYGEEWRLKRKICVLELLSLKRVQSFQYIRDEEAEDLVNKIRQACDHHQHDHSFSVNMSQMIIATSNNIVSRCLLGQKFETANGRRSFGEVARRVMLQLSAFSFGDFFPSLRWMDVVTGLIPKLNATFRELDAFFDEVIAQHKAAKRNGDDDNDDHRSEKKDFVDILSQLQQDDLLDLPLTQSDLKAMIIVSVFFSKLNSLCLCCVCVKSLNLMFTAQHKLVSFSQLDQDLFVGGSDTTSTALEWAFAELMKNPRVMNKAQDEVRKVMGNRSKVEEKDVRQMKYLECVVKETLRLHPPLALLVPRETRSDVSLGGYCIPPKTTVFINAWGIQRDPQFWDRPEEFEPERFEDSQVDFKGQDFEFVPFGIGRRGCPGLSFGVASLEYVMANLLYWFDWKIPETGNKSTQDIDMCEVFGINVVKKLPICVQPVPYQIAS